MKQYVIDELRLGDYQKIKQYLNDKYASPSLGEIYWIPIDEALLSDIQAAHSECQPHYFAAFLQENSLSCELLMRTKNKIKCECITYAAEDQRNWLIRKIDNILDELDVQI